jgi:transposase-like protein
VLSPIHYVIARRWALKFGPHYARRFKRKRPNRRDIWHLDELLITSAGRKHWLWRAIDQNGYVLDEIVQPRRDTNVAKRLLRQLKEARLSAHASSPTRPALIPGQGIADAVRYGLSMPFEPSPEAPK